MNFKTEILWNGREQISVKAKNKIAETDMDLNFIMFNFYLSLRIKMKVNWILLKLRILIFYE